MNTTVPEGIELAKAVVAKASEVPASVKLIIAPPFTHLYPVAEVVKGSTVGLSAQNCADKEKGAYTGEVSVKMLSSVGCQYTILGHSERRQYYGETDAKLVEKVKLAIAEGLSPIFCVGENLEEREAGRHFDVVSSQVKNVLYTLSAASRYGPSVQARPLPQSRLRRSTHASVRCLPRNSEPLQRRSLSSTAEAASHQTQRNSSHAQTSTADSSAVQPSRQMISSPSHCHSSH